jgi:predicted nucleic acid-binding protein
MILELAVASKSDCIITYNKQDFVQASRLNIQIFTPREYLKSRRII